VTQQIPPSVNTESNQQLATVKIKILVLNLLFSSLGFAKTHSIDWYKIAGGGGNIGQLDASGAMSGGNYLLTVGFWALSALQTPAHRCSP